MPFKRVVKPNVGTAPVTVLTVAAAKVCTLIDCSAANVEPGSTEVKATVRQVAGADTCNLIKAGPVPVGSAIVVVGAPRKVVLQAGDQLVALCDKAAGMDVAISYLEQDA